MNNEHQQIERTHNTARFFTETRHVAWVLLIGTMIWGVYGYLQMPQRKDPDIPVRQALALCPWPGASAEKIEQLVTRRIEEKIAENVRVDKVESNTRTGVTAVYITLVEGTKDTGKEFDDIKLKLDSITNLPDGAGPIEFVKDFGDTAALMLTVSSPKVGEAEIAARAQALRQEIEATRKTAPDAGGSRLTLVQGVPTAVTAELVRRPLRLFADAASAEGLLEDPRIIIGPGFVAIDARSTKTDAELQAFVQHFIRERMRASELHPDAWPVTIVRDPAQIQARLAAVAGDKYTYSELDDYTDLISRSLKTLPIVSKVTRSGLLDERVYLEYSQERLASYGVKVGTLERTLGARNIAVPGGVIESGDKNVTVDPSGEFKNEREIGDVLVATSNGRSLYLRDVATVARGYESPARFLNFYGSYQKASLAEARHDGSRAEAGEWRRSRAVTMAVQMRAGQKIGDFATLVDAKLEELGAQLPKDLVLARTSDQPRQVEENIHLFMGSLWEAVALVVLVSLIGFWEWRSALLMALSIPVTLAMTFGMMSMFGMDLQQVSIASLIIALGLLVDDPVVAGDAIKRDLAAGHPPVVAAWWGPTKLAKAILFATITNIVAYVPFLILPGDPGQFVYSLPVVIGSSLVASRIVSMTFIPLLGYYLLKPKAEKSIEERRQSGFAAAYYRLGTAAIRHRWAFLAASFLVVVIGGSMMRLKTQFFPVDLQYLSYVDVWLPEDAPVAATNRVAGQVEATVRHVVDEYAKTHSDDPKQPREVLKSLTTFVGGGGPRFWFSVAPEQRQPNYAQVLIEVTDKHDTRHLIAAIQEALNASITGARLDVRQLETGPPVGIPVSIRLSGEDIGTLRTLATQVADIFRAIPQAVRIRDNWGPESFTVRLRTDSDKANLSGLTNYDVAAASASAMSGARVGVLREGDEQIPVVARLRMDERAQLSDIRSLYVYAGQGAQKVPLQSISSIAYEMQIEKLQRRNQFRTITVSAFPDAGVLPSEVLNVATPRLDELRQALPTGYRLEIGGEFEEQVKGFKNLAIVMLISIAMIYLALVFQFKHAIKPLIVFAAIPFGVMGALAALWVMGAAFGFMAFLGIISLIGVIVSHIIVLFDFIEERHEQGEPLEEALLDAGIIRLRPVLITVAATVTALFPLAAHGGPLWEPLCYTQIGGLTVATFVTLLLVPVLYATFVLDLKLVKWEKPHHHAPAPEPPAQAAVSVA